MGIGGRPSRTDSSKDQVQVKITPNDSESPEIRKYKKRFTSDILCAALWGVNLLIGTEAGLMLLDRSGQGKGLRQHCTLAPLSLCGWSGLGLIAKYVFTNLSVDCAYGLEITVYVGLCLNMGKVILIWNNFSILT